MAPMASGGRGQTTALSVRPGLAGECAVLHAGTLIVFLMTAVELWVAADSRVVAIGAQQTEATTICKIHKVGAVFYAEAGLLKDTTGRFNAAAIAEQAAVGHPTVPEVAHAFEARVLMPLMDTVSQLRTLNPHYYYSHVREQAALQVAFFGAERRGLRLAIRRFFIHTDGQRRPSVSIDRFDCPGDCDHARTWAFLGGSEVLNRFLEANPRYLTEHGSRATLQRLMDLEAIAHPDLVSPPVDILQIGPEGPAWVQRKPSCPPLPPS
jgi:hypothetical protein